MKRGRKKKCFAYLRVSGNGQKDGQGFDRQRQTIRRFAGRAGYEIAREFEDVHTGTADAVDRPGFGEMLRALNAVRTIIVERLDRLSRDNISSQNTIIWLAAHNVELVVADTGENVTKAYLDDPMKKALIQMQATFSELEKNMIVKKLRAAREKVRKERGRCEGRKAYGSEDPRELGAVERIKELRKKRKGMRPLGPGKIAKILEEEGYPTRKAKHWNPSTVSSIIKGDVYKRLK